MRSKMEQLKWRAIVCTWIVAAFWITPRNAISAPLTVSDSKYYVIHSDLDAATVREASLRMTCMAEVYYERTRSLAVGQINRKFKFMLFSQRADYLAAGGAQGSIGVFLANQPDHPLAALRLDDRPELLWHTIQHEGFHQFSMEVLGGGQQPLPAWLEEGLADYFGYAQFTGEDLVTGVIPPDRLAMVQQMMLSGRFRPLTKLLSMTRLGWNNVADGVDYLEVWSLVHYLVHAQDGKFRPAFERYIKVSLQPKGPVISLREALGGGENLEKEWRQWWLAQEPDATKDLYAQAAGTALCAYLGRAVAQKQMPGTVEEILALVESNKLKLSEADWLPPSLVNDIRRWISINGTNTKFEIGKDQRNPHVTVTLSDGTHLVATYNNALKSHRVSVVFDALAAEMNKAVALIIESKQVDARKLLQEAMRKYPKSPQTDEARKLLQQTYATASTVQPRPPVVQPKPPVVEPKPATGGPVATANVPRTKPGLPALPPLMVVSARYGIGDTWANVTDPMRELVKDGVLGLPKFLSKDFGIDPRPDVMKYIDLIVMVDGVPMRFFIAENIDAPPFQIAAEGHGQ